MTSRIRATSRVHLLKAGTILILFVLFSLVYSCRQKRSMGTVEGGISAEMDHTRFAGDRTCRSCHRAEWEEWAGSHHQNAMAEASEESVLGDFRDVIFQEGMDRYRFFRKGEKFLVEAPGPDGRQQVYEVKYTFGFDPLQLYLVDFGKGKYQVLHAAWDRERKEWFSLYPEESFRPGDWLHWTGGAMNWNSMCADCHSTNLKSRYIAEADSFHTTWAAVNVSCEACHGPGRVHADRMRFPESERASPEQVRSDLHSLVDVSAMSEIRTCAPCHSLRESLTDSYLHEGDFLDHFNPLLPHPPSYHPDGQVLQESFEFGSFLQSRMSAHEVRCTDCHHPHTLQLKETLDGNRLCLTCHDPRYDRRQHHFHPIGTEASHCVNCHMPGTYFMEVDFRRDHSFRIPRPDLSEVLGTPNACNQCHTDRTSEWAASNLEQWYGKKEADPFLEAVTALTEGKRGASDLLRQFLEDRSRPEVLRAAAIRHLMETQDPDLPELLQRAAGSDQPLVRAAAARALADLPADFRRPVLTRLLRDDVRAVRLAAFRGLADLHPVDLDPPERTHFRKVLDEFETYLERNRYFPQGEMNLADFHARRGEIGEAIRAYERALEKDPDLHSARMNLAWIHNGLGENRRAEELLGEVIAAEPEWGEAYYSLALVLAEEQRFSEAVELFRLAAGRMPYLSRLFYNWAIALQRLDRPEEARQRYLEAIRLEPENPEFRYGLITLYIQQEEVEKAHAEALTLQGLYPERPEYRQLVRMIEQALN